MLILGAKKQNTNRLIMLYATTCCTQLFWKTLVSHTQQQFVQCAMNMWSVACFKNKKFWFFSQFFFWFVEPWWSTAIVCVFDQAHSTPKRGWAHRGKDRLQKGFTVNSNTVVLGTWKINKMRLVRMAEKGSKTKLYRGFPGSIKKHWRQ